MEEMKELKDLVPPLELCEQAAEVVGNGTALVWAHTGRDYEVTSREVWEIIEVCFDAIPAPTLAELMEMLPETVGNGEVLIFEYGKIKGQKEAIVHYPGMREYCGHDVNPATAALRLLMKVKGVTE